MFAGLTFNSRKITQLYRAYKLNHYIYCRPKAKYAWSAIATAINIMSCVSKCENDRSACKKKEQSTKIEVYKKIKAHCIKEGLLETK
jgi:hypothetical protein